MENMKIKNLKSIKKINEILIEIKEIKLKVPVLKTGMQ